MNYPLLILTATAGIGAADVLYYHLYRFRLFAQPSSVAEEITHLCRHAIFLAMLVLLSSGDRSARLDMLVLGLFALDLINSAADVVLERGSRAALGGLPSMESLVHSLSTFSIGLAAATYVLVPGLPAPSGLLAWQVWFTFAAGALIFALEATLFARAVRTRRQRAMSTAGSPNLALSTHS